MSVHDPVLPVWSCGGCDLPWPCPTRRRELRAEFDDAPVSLALYLGAQLVRASADAPAGLTSVEVAFGGGVPPAPGRRPGRSGSRAAGTASSRCPGRAVKPARRPSARGSPAGSRSRPR
ncbi:hypothetical protein [Micromonospora sp. GCM10011541]|uniref:hypothetical protein n=1 Tax=Micromonospora TaxID=1873 RepID=UPI003610C1FF